MHCKSKETAIEYHQRAMVHCSKDFSVNKPYSATRVVLLLGHYQVTCLISDTLFLFKFQTFVHWKSSEIAVLSVVGCWEEAISKLSVVFGVEPPLQSLLFTGFGTQWEKIKQDTLVNYLCKLFSRVIKTPYVSYLALTLHDLGFDLSSSPSNRTNSISQQFLKFHIWFPTGVL